MNWLKALFIIGSVGFMVMMASGCESKSDKNPGYQVTDHQLDLHENFSRENERNRIYRDQFREATKN